MPWQPELWVEFNLLNTFGRALPKEHPCQVSSRLAQWFRRRRCLKKLWTTHDARRTTNAAKLSSKLERAHEVARANLKTAQKRMKKSYDLRQLVYNYKVGDVVYLLEKAVSKGKCKKLCPPWKGPGVVIEKLSESLFRVKIGNAVSVVNHDRMKKCKDRDLPEWIKRLRESPEAIQDALKSAKGDRNALYCLCRKPDDGKIMI